MPLPTARRPYAPLVQRRCDCPRRRGARRLNLSDDRKHVRRKGVGAGALRLGALGAGGGQINRVAQLHALRLAGLAQRPG